MHSLVISGMGAMTPIGANVEQFWKQLLAGKCAVSEIRSFDTSHFSMRNGCEIAQASEFHVSGKPLGRAAGLLLPAIEDALYDAGLEWPSPHYRIGLSVGTTMGEIQPLEQAVNGSDCPGQVRGGAGAIARQIAETMGVAGPVWTVANACAAGNFAIMRAAEEIVAGRADIMIAAGVDSMSWAAFVGFNSLRAMSPDVPRPFDANRKGLVLGEGAGVVILESGRINRERGGKARAELIGWGASSDAWHITRPHPGGRGAKQAIRAALQMSNLTPEDIDYISAHGTGTVANDSMEAAVMGDIFGESVWTSSIKGHIGHTLGAASAIEAVACIKVLETGMLPPTLNLREQDPDCKINVVHGEPMPHECRYVMSNAYAFGGVNSSIVIRRYEQSQ